jgi:hypothetical protein
MARAAFARDLLAGVRFVFARGPETFAVFRRVAGFFCSFCFFVAIFLRVS